MNTLQHKAVIYFSLTHASILEAIRRKDLYVALILSLLMVGGAMVLGTVGIKDMEVFLRNVTLTIINVFTVVLAVIYATRQIQEEVERRTIYPLLARPLSRTDFVVGKFLGAYTLSLVSLVLFSFVGWGLLTLFGIPVGAIWGQHLLLRAFALGIVCAFTLGLSLLLPASATVAAALCLTAAFSSLGAALPFLHGGAAQAASGAYQGSYYLLPHLDLFDLTNKASSGWKPVGGGVIGGLGLYAAVYIALFLCLSVWRFERRAL